MTTISFNATSAAHSGWRRITRRVFEWRRRSLSRHELAGLDDIGLRDIGISRGSAEFEASKPFWMA